MKNIVLSWQSTKHSGGSPGRENGRMKGGVRIPALLTLPMLLKAKCVLHISSTYKHLSPPSPASCSKI